MEKMDIGIKDVIGTPIAIIILIIIIIILCIVGKVLIKHK